MSTVRFAAAGLGVIVAVAAATVALSSGEPSVKPLPRSSVFDGRDFVASKVTGFELVPGTVPRSSFDDGRFSVSAGGGNDADGGYAVSGNRLRTLRVTSTLIGCDGTKDAQDRWIIDVLNGAQVRERGDSIELRSGRTRITFEPVRSSPRRGPAATPRKG